MWSFVGQKDNKVWIWLAIDLNTKEIVGVFIGDRSKKGAKGLWDSLPPVYRQCAVCYTDFWEAYELIFPSSRHHAVSKQTGKTNHIGILWNFIHHYNAIRTRA
jgi:IS1 family transposase